MKAFIGKSLKACNESAGAINAASFTWNIANGVINWYHNHKHHHTIRLTSEQEQHLSDGGTLQVQYDCGNVLQVKL
jgi:hypothetical protein